MAYKSLIDYYGGGMVKPSDGYQLGGLVAGARRQRDYSGELRNLQQLAEQSARRKQKAQRKGGILKTALGIGGTLLGGPMGAAVGSALGQALGEKSYKDTSFKGGKYAQDIRGQLGEQEKAYKGQGMARVGLAGLAGYGAGKAGGMFGKAAKGIKGLGSDIGMIKGAMAGEGGATFGEAVKGLYGGDIASMLGGKSSMLGKSMLASMTPKVASAAQAAPAVGKTLGKDFYEAVSEEPVDQSTGFLSNVTETVPEDYDPSYIDMPAGYESSGRLMPGAQGPLASGLDPYGNPLDVNLNEGITETSNVYAGQGPLQNEQPFMPTDTINDPAYFMAGDESLASAAPDSSSVGQSTQVAGGAGGGGYFSNLIGGRSFGDIMGQGVSNMLQGLYTTGSLLGGASQPYSKRGGGLIQSLTPKGYQDGGYATATDPEEALRQMGMEDVVNDRRFKDYLEDLPEFGMGYEQKIGDVMAGGRSGLMDISQQARTQQAGTGFAGGGAGAVGQARARKELQRGVGTQRRGVVEGYQADLLSAVADIEAKGGFEFGEGSYARLGTGLTGGEDYDPTATAPPGWPSIGAYDNWVQAGSDPNTASNYGWQSTQSGDTPGGYKP